MSIFNSFSTRKVLEKFFRYPHLKTFYKGSLFGFEEIVGLYENIINNGNSAKLFGAEFYGLEKVNYYTLDEIFMSSVYLFETENPTPVIIDCGANIGLSILYFKQTHKDALVYAFEPDTKNAGYLQKNINSYHWENSVFLEQKLVSDSDGFEYFEELGNAGSKIIGKNQQNASSSKIPKIRLKDFIKKLDKKIDFLKLDIEGSEFKVIPDLKPVFNKIQRMYIEFHCEENDFEMMYGFIKEHLADDFRFQVSTNFTEDQNIYHAMQNKKSKTYYNCFLVNKNL
jgi:FkbM family methyltransferase